MALEQATAQQRMGQSVVRRLANARLVPDGGVSVDGQFIERPSDVPSGAYGATAQLASFRAIASETPEIVVHGQPCSVFVGDQRQILHGRYTVRGREDSLLIDTARLDLERAA